ncbi:peroxidase 17-like [Andrographis paniculata]|uniref:peroxidase 17-like n=1 Tax=Andrographis paniculata TaxID=175694 RepID=UPI0021E7F6DD|nr:peroxidase 17-like [Andrographis paniculata]
MSPTILILLYAFFLSEAAATAPPPPPPLRQGFYAETCPAAESIARNILRRAMARDARSAASVMRLQFHDCFVNGCDGSLLLEKRGRMEGEKSALSNINSVRSYEVIDEIKEAMEAACPAVVSCADIIIMAARDAVLLSGGPNWEVKLGRKDSLWASLEAANEIMPSPRANATFLIHLFSRYNLTVKDLVALSGSHSIGKARCFSVLFRLYNQSGSGKPDPAINPTFRKDLDKLCPQHGDVEVTANLDATPKRFDNQYYRDLAHGRGFLNSDQTLYTSMETRKYVKLFARSEEEFFIAFVRGMVKLGDIRSGLHGEIRRNCRVVN